MKKIFEAKIELPVKFSSGNQIEQVKTKTTNKNLLSNVFYEHFYTG